MIICPWCGTNYVVFQSNCKNCGGIIEAPHDPIAVPDTFDALPVPPPAPRQISDRYIWRLLASDGWAIAAFVFCLLGLIFGFVALGLLLPVVTALIGVIFLFIALPFLGAGVGVLIWRHQAAQKLVGVLRDGLSAEGRITALEENYSVRINGRHPWVIGYEYGVNGQSHTGRVSTLNLPGDRLQVGKPVRVLYLAGEPTFSSIYPHP